MWTTPVILAEGITKEAGQACKDDGSLCSAIKSNVVDNEFIAQFLGVLIPDILLTILIFAVAWFIARIVRKIIRKVVRDMVERGHDRANGTRKRLSLASTQSIDPARAAMRTETLGNVLRSLASLIIWTSAVFVAVASLRTVDINLGPLIAGAGIVGVALGFGSQSLVKDFLSGIFMLLEDQYGVGDIIDSGPATGIVEGITLRTTRLRDIEGVLWHVPNGEITRVGNLSQQWSRSLLDIPVAYSTDIQEAITVIKQTADDLWDDPSWTGLVLDEPDVWGVEAFGDSAILIRLVIKVVPAQQWAVSRELRMRLKAAFDDAGIEIPFPQTVVWMRSKHDGDDPGAAGEPLPASTDEDRTRHRARTGEYDSAPPASSDGEDAQAGPDGEGDDR